MIARALWSSPRPPLPHFFTFTSSLSLLHFHFFTFSSSPSLFYILFFTLPHSIHLPNSSRPVATPTTISLGALTTALPRQLLRLAQQPALCTTPLAFTSRHRIFGYYELHREVLLHPVQPALPANNKAQFSTIDSYGPPRAPANATRT